jgi:hypothetical protein
MTAASGVRLRLIQFAAAGALLVLYFFMAVSAAAQKSMTFDEMAHLTAGYSYWLFDDYRLHPENGNWPQRLGALPALWGAYSFPRLDQPAWRTSNVYAIGDQFLYFSGNDAGTVLSRARRVMALLAVALGALVFAWAWRLTSPLGAWVSLLLFAFSPTLLAHGPLVTSDIAAAFFFTAASGAIWVALHRATPLTVFAAAVLVGGACLSKLSGPILVPIALVMLAIRLTVGRPLSVRIAGAASVYQTRGRQLAVLLGVGTVIAVGAWALIWASFGFRYAAFAAGTTGNDAFLGQVRDVPGISGWLLSTARQFHLLPEAYIYGAGLTVQFSSERAAFLNGEFSTTGWWWYFPYAFAVKTTIPGMILGGLGLMAFVAPQKRSEGGAGQTASRLDLYEATPLLVLVGVYGAFALTTNLNIGQRHLLPMYPALCILAGGVALWMRPLLDVLPGRMHTPEVPAGADRRKPRSQAKAQPKRSAAPALVGVATLVLLGWHIAESLIIRPHYLAYFNQSAGGPSQGYRHLADSSLDWGQDLPALKAWLDREGLQQPGSTPVYLSYFGTARPEYYGIRAIPLAGFVDRRAPEPIVPLRGGVYCISATVLDVIGTMFYKPEYESNYQAGMQNAAIFARASGNEEAKAALVRETGEDYWRQLFVQTDQLRTGRLVAFLRRRQPDAMVGYSILIYRLTDADVAEALTGPVPPA